MYSLYIYIYTVNPKIENKNNQILFSLNYYSPITKIILKKSKEELESKLKKQKVRNENSMEERIAEDDCSA